MTLATNLGFPDFTALAESAFQAEVPQVSCAESDLGAPLQRFDSPAAMAAKAIACANEGRHHYAFALWYPAMKGRVLERRLTLDPPRDGHDFRYSLGGWGLIQLRLYFTPAHTLQCSVAVNSESRALARQDRYPELGAVSDWDWRVVETHAYQLTRRLATMGRTAPVVQPSAPPPNSPWRR